MREFSFTWNGGRGKMTLNLDVLLKRRNGKFVNTTKGKVLKIMKYIITSDEPEKIYEFLHFLETHDGYEIAQQFRVKHKLNDGGIAV